MEQSLFQQLDVSWLHRLAQQRMIAWLAGIAAVFQALLLLIPGPYLVGTQHFAALYGLLGSLVILFLNRHPENLNWIKRVTFSVVAVWLGLDFWTGVQERRGVSMWMALDTVLAGVMLFSFLPARLAVRWSALTYLLFVLAALGARTSDLAVVGYVGVLLAFTGYLASHGQLLADERLRSEVLRWQVQHDGLTGAVTRQALLETLEPLLGGRHVVLMVDLDHFKAVNDQFGHMVGDRALRHLVEVLRARVRQGDMVCRWGGEEFLVLLRDVSLEQGQGLAERLREAVKTSVSPGIPPLTISLGVASLERVTSVPELLVLVDARMYAAKAGGRDRVFMT